MRTLLLFCVFSLASSQLIINYNISDESIDAVANANIPSSECYIAPWMFCQNAFNEAVGIDATINFRNGTLFFKEINSLTRSNSTQLRNLCQQNSYFHQCLGTNYYACVNLHNVLNTGSVDKKNAFDYVHTFTGLDFICTAGYKEAMNGGSCLNNIQSTKAYQNCIQGFNPTADKLCQSVDKSANCLKQTYGNACGDSIAAKFGCENFVVTFEHSCNATRCT